MTGINEQENLPNTEEPKRIKGFLDALCETQWSDDKLFENLNTIFNELNKLALSDLEYYNKKRAKHGKISNLTRQTSLIFGTIGALALILQNYKPISTVLSNMVAISTACFTIAAAALAWNRLFGASGGHIRYVMAQFDLGERMVNFTLKWHEWQNKNKGLQPKEIDISGAFDLFSNFSKDIYKIVRDETQIWGKSVMDAMEEQYKSSQQHNP